MLAALTAFLRPYRDAEISDTLRQATRVHLSQTRVRLASQV